MIALVLCAEVMFMLHLPSLRSQGGTTIPRSITNLNPTQDA